MTQTTWQRIMLLLILAYEGIGGLLGGILLVLGPDGHYMKMPVEIMHGYFPNFLIPGLILTSMGALTASVFFAVLFKKNIAWLLSFLSMGGYIIWFATEIVLVGTHWLQIMWGVPVIVGFLLVLPMVPFLHKKTVVAN